MCRCRLRADWNVRPGYSANVLPLVLSLQLFNHAHIPKFIVPSALLHPRIYYTSPRASHPAPDTRSRPFFSITWNICHFCLERAVHCEGYVAGSDNGDIASNKPTSPFRPVLVLRDTILDHLTCAGVVLVRGFLYKLGQAVCNCRLHSDSFSVRINEAERVCFSRCVAFSEISFELKQHCAKWNRGLLFAFSNFVSRNVRKASWLQSRNKISK